MARPNDGVTFTVDQVPDEYREPFILTGYRRPRSSFRYCIASTFRWHNETLNIWTHLVPVVAFAAYFWTSFPSRLWPLSAIEPYYYPLLAEEFSILAYHLCSTVAHTFNCMKPRVRHICFYLDYAAISTYGIGVSCSTALYTWPSKSELFLFKSPSHYVRCSSVLCTVVMYVMCASRHKCVNMKYVVRTLACMSVFIFTSAPTFYRCLRYLRYGESHDHLQYLYYLFVGWSTCILAGVLNPTRFPERLCLGAFDIVGHNHQIVHILATITSLSRIWVVQVNIYGNKTHISEQQQSHDFYLQWTITATSVILLIALWFAKNLKPSGHFKV